MATVQNYALFLTTAAPGQLVGMVVNVVMWDGSSAWAPPTGQAAVADPTGKYPIGSIYTLPSSAA